MNFPFRVVRRTSAPAPSPPRSVLKACWSRDPRSGRLVQAWKSSDDGERSCTGRPDGPPSRLPLAA